MIARLSTSTYYWLAAVLYSRTKVPFCLRALRLAPNIRTYYYLEVSLGLVEARPGFCISDPAPVVSKER